MTINEKQGNEQEAAIAYHQLGVISQQQRDFSTAGDWYQKALAINEKQGNEQRAAITYHQLGSIAEQQRDFSAARDWYQKSLVIKEKQGNARGAAITYHQLGNVAEQQSDYSTAANLFALSVNKFIQTNDNHNLAIAMDSFFNLITQVRKDQHGLETALINHFNATNVDCLPDWSEIEKMLTEQLTKASP